MRGTRVHREKFSDRYKASFFTALSVFVVACALFFAAAPLPAAASGCPEGEAFPSSESGWHTVTIDLGSSVLVRTYGKILTAETPTDISVTMGETLSFVNAWIGDSKGDPVGADAIERYLVIEGTAVNLIDATDTKIHEIVYTLDDVRYAQFVGAPMRLSAAASSDHDASGGGCETGLGVVSLLTVLALAPLHAQKKRH